MPNPIKKLLFFLTLLLTVSFIGCDSQGDDAPPNPFDEVEAGPGGVDPELINVDPQSITGLHTRIFRPTCANSGCHDGTFEPDFRSIESSYNTLLLHPIIKNDPDGTYTFRVVPGNPEESVLWNRMTEDIDGQSGIMPLSIDPDSDWEEKKDEHLANLRAWIEAGAPDMFGNTSQGGNLPPTLQGMVALIPGQSTPLTRDGRSGPVVVPGGTSQLEIWLSIKDDRTASADLTGNIRLSAEINGFSGRPQQALSVESPVSYPGFSGDVISYRHKLTIDLSSFNPGTRVYLRAYIQDPQIPAPVEMPADGSIVYIKDYYALGL
ncbi:MAG: hypothetical protein AAGI38_00990 [Bacteroidota bacterium]